MPIFHFFAKLLLLALVLSACPVLEAQEATMAKVSGSAGTDFHTRLELETFRLINQYRTANKLPPFKWNEEIAKVARGHSQDMATGESDFGHEGFGDRVKVLKTKLIGLNGAGENVLKTDDPDQVAQTAVRVWLHSPHHLANIRGDFNCSGMGVWRDDKGMIYFTQFFVKIVPPVPVAATAASPQPATVSPLLFLAQPKTR